ncbi:hypothetical protein PAPYR_1713 [Paratrimastix pyriformis]|uniref:Uncharacterized protein n=1 Tax=Paratrimastix pyriformis TaxID=342808 RepID=A0ABQ8UR35_9EUKA|nr:hypothetical protein PAPYR_1713 [Paratrimastix pyriformis]
MLMLLGRPLVDEDEVPPSPQVHDITPTSFPGAVSPSAPRVDTTFHSLEQPTAATATTFPAPPQPPAPANSVTVAAGSARPSPLMEGFMRAHLAPTGPRPAALGAPDAPRGPGAPRGHHTGRTAAHRTNVDNKNDVDRHSTALLLPGVRLVARRPAPSPGLHRRLLLNKYDPLGRPALERRLETNQTREHLHDHHPFHHRRLSSDNNNHNNHSRAFCPPHAPTSSARPRSGDNWAAAAPTGVGQPPAERSTPKQCDPLATCLALAAE